MAYRIIGDSCTDLPNNLRENEHIRLVPLSLIVDDVTVIDNETFCQKNFMQMVDKSPNAPKSACPSPEAYMNEMNLKEISM
jgi:fatty acid-binding protein DegV